ncbi:methyltransferase domain-containing protein [Tateyamaria sp.]|uniref:methyltransferase domain-containing protein n=1 Tax=Tateyamaria sp. TaxID=1929288 RepID=UPI00329E4E0F
MTLQFFDFLADNEDYDASIVSRMNLRHKFLIAPFENEIRGSSVLDIAAHDGRWSYALAAAGAAEVYGVEARRELIEKFSSYPQSDFKSRVTLKENDLYRELDHLIETEATFDVVVLFGIFYHVMDHYGLLAKVSRLNPKVIIIDSEFITTANPMIQLVKERTDHVLNAIAQVPDQQTTLIGIPSTTAMERMANVLGYDCDWLDWDSVPKHLRIGVKDYYRKKPKRRRTCVLRPATSSL